jgi:adenylylsulfate kinase
LSPSQPTDNNIVWHHATVTRERRQQQNGHKSVILWFTGLSGAGKSTLAHAVEEELHQRRAKTFVLDGDNVRHGLCSDLSFNDEDRKENIRRIGETAKLMLESGVIVLSAFISPFREDRRVARSLFPHGEFIEIYCDCSLGVCESRDPKGIYQKARKGEIAHFTGISSPYEVPEKPEIAIKTDEQPLSECVQQIVNYLWDRGIVSK